MKSNISVAFNNIGMHFFSAEEMMRRLDEYLDARPCIDLSVSSDESEAIEDVNLDSHAAELGTEPPSVLTEQTSVAAER